MNHSKSFRWFCLIIFVLIPLFLLPAFIDNLVIAKLIKEDNICNSITFYYGNNRTINTYDDSPTGIHYVLLPSYTDMNNIGVEVTTNSVSFVAQEEQINIKKGPVSFWSFQSEVEYKVSFKDFFGNVLATDTIVFLKSENLPTLYIETNSGSMEYLDSDKSHSEGGRYELIGNNGTVLASNTLESISARGNQTFQFEKKSYQIDLAQPVDLLDMGISDTWILLCNVYDPSYIRNKITYDMALNANMYGAPRSEYIDVYFNGNYAGMYLLAEKVEFAENRLEYTDMESLNISVNGGSLKSFPSYLSEDNSIKAIDIPYNPTDISGGYLIEHDYGYKYDEVKSAFITSDGEQFVLKNPEHASIEEVCYIRGIMQEIEDAIKAPNGINPNTGKHYTEYIDIDSWVDKYLVEEISRNDGGGATSSYFYKLSDDISTKVYGGPVWDYDKAYGNYRHYSNNTRDLAFLTLHNNYTNWFYYLYKHEDFREKVKENYALKFSDYLESAVTTKIDQYTSLIAASAKLDNARFSHIYSEDEQNYSVLAEEIQQFIVERADFLNQVWIEEVPITLVHFKYEWENGNRTIGVITGETIEDFPYTSLDNQTLVGWQQEDGTLVVTPDTPITEEITLVPIWEEK